MESTYLISIDNTYSTAIYVILPLVTIYCGLFLSISNHYILRPKIESFLQKASFSSTIAIEVLLDILSNLSFITYALSAFLLTAPADHPIRILEFYNSYWLTLCLGLVIYFKVPVDIKISNIVFCKNGLILALCYINIMYHYIDSNKFVTLPAIFGGLYLLNLLLNSYEQKFVQVMLDLLNLKQPKIFKSKTKMISHLPTVQQLAKNYPISRKQLDKDLQIKKKNLQHRDHFDESKKQKLPKAKIDTKLIAQQKLLQICTCIHLSMLKKQQQQKMGVRQYIGLMNGTIQNVKAIGQNKARSGVRSRTYFNSRNKDKENLTKRTTKKLKENLQSQSQHKIRRDKDKQQLLQQKNNITLLSDKNNKQEYQQTHSPQIQNQSILFYIFPVRIFQSSRIVSVVFAILINLAVGILFNYTHNVMLTLKYGRFSDFILPIMFLPVIPPVSPIQFTNTLALSSILKYGIIGVFACISVGINSSTSQNPELVPWQMTPYLQYNTIIQLIVLIISFGVVISEKRLHRFLILFFLIIVGLNCLICYLSIASTNN